MANSKRERTTEKGYIPPIVSDTVKNYDNDPFVVDKVAKAKEFLRLHPIPDNLLKK